MTIESIVSLREGETPWSYSQSPGELLGPWGESAEEAIAAYGRETGDRIAEWWERDGALWVIAEERDAQEASR